MIKDIPELDVHDLAIAIAPPEDDTQFESEVWDVFIINLKEEPIRSVFVTSKAYGEIDNEPRKSTVFRQFFENIEPLDTILLEPIHRDLFQLSNEFWVSFSADGQIYDKKYIFVAGSLDPILFTTIPFTSRRGVLMR